MRTKLLLTIFLAASTFCIAQVPSINLNDSHKSTIFTNSEASKIVELEKKEKEISKSIKKLKSDNTEKAKKEAELKVIKDEKNKIIGDNFRYKYNNDYYNNQISKVDARIEKLKKDLNEASKDDNRSRINSYESELKSLEKEKDRLEVEKKRKLNPGLNNYNWFLPSKNPMYRNAFFEDTYNNSTDKTNYLNAFSVVGSPNGITGQSEIVADNINMLRITFGTVITASNASLASENTRVEALQRLINGGGNFYFDFTVPLATTIKGNEDDELINAYSFANVKSAADIKGYGNNIEASTYNTSLGLNLYADLSSENKRFNFFIIANSNYYYGCTKEFYENLDINHNRGFLSGKVTIGVTLLNQFRFSANVLTYGSEPSLRSNKVTAGIQFLPKL